MINTYTIFPSRKSVRFIVSELFAETCHTIPQSLVWRRHVGFPPKSTNTAAWNQQEHLKNFRWQRFLFVRELNYLSLIMSSNGWLAKNHKVGVTHSENSKLQNAVFWKWQTRRGLRRKKRITEYSSTILFLKRQSLRNIWKLVDGYSVTQPDLLLGNFRSGVD